MNFKKNKLFQDYASNTFWLFLDKILRLLCGVFIGVWVARYLGTEKFGLYSFAISFVGIFNFLIDLGLENIVIREIVKHPNKTFSIIGSSFILKIIGSFLLILTVVITLQFTKTTDYEKLIVILTCLGQLFLSFDVLDYYFKSQIQGIYSSISGTIALLISSVFRILFLIGKFELEYFIGALIFEQFVRSLFLLIFFAKNKLYKNLKFSIETAFFLLNDSWPLMFSGMMVSLYMRIDQIMIKEILGNQLLGVYSAAVKLSEAWYFIPLIVTQSILPALVDLQKEEKKYFDHQFVLLFRCMFIFSLSIIIPLLFFSDHIINFLYGNSYIESSSIFKIHIWTGLFVSLGFIRGKWILVKNLQRYSFIFTFIVGVVNVVLNYYLIPFMGIKGAAYATLIAHISTLLIFPLLFKKTRKSVVLIIRILKIN